MIKPHKSCIPVVLSLGLLAMALAGCGDDDPAAPPKTTEVVVSATLAFESAYLDLDSGATETGMTFPNSATMDLKAAYNSGRTIHTVVFQQSSRQIAHLTSRTFASVTRDDATAATFTSNLIDDPFDGSRVILIKTELGAIYKLGNATEDNAGVTFDYAKLVDAP